MNTSTKLVGLALLVALGASAHLIHAQDPHGHHAPHANQAEPFLAKHVEKSASITLHGDIDSVWPLFDPINESKWVSVWNPELLHPNDGQVQEGMVFRTSGGMTWVLSRYDRQNYRITYTVYHAEEVRTIDIQCSKHGTSYTDATVTYRFVGLTELGNQLIEKAAKRMFASDLRDWQKLINHFLKTGETLPVDEAHGHGDHHAPHRKHG